MNRPTRYLSPMICRIPPLLLAMLISFDAKSAHPLDTWKLVYPGQTNGLGLNKASSDLLSWKDVLSPTLGPTGSIQLDTLAATADPMFYRALPSGLASGGK